MYVRYVAPYFYFSILGVWSLRRLTQYEALQVTYTTWRRFAMFPGEFGVNIKLAGWFLSLFRALRVLTYRTPVLFTRCLSRAMSLPCLLVLPRYEREHCDFV